MDRIGGGRPAARPFAASRTVRVSFACVLKIIDMVLKKWMDLTTRSSY